eukprot:TRINITY_DN2171_c0_g1_i7.p1 TRINITY_DN2171_c0_g1~~TRINITY_DN2171_c0_g1_i7.p1  ORF type:complete len:2208 (+),score=585.43 TRINITY_DN2171_c0_g1_i7:124-6624(+)
MPTPLRLQLAQDLRISPSSEHARGLISYAQALLEQLHALEAGESRPGSPVAAPADYRRAEAAYLMRDEEQEDYAETARASRQHFAILGRLQREHKLDDYGDMQSQFDSVQKVLRGSFSLHSEEFPPAVVPVPVSPAVPPRRPSGAGQGERQTTFVPEGAPLGDAPQQPADPGGGEGGGEQGDGAGDESQAVRSRGECRSPECARKLKQAQEIASEKAAATAQQEATARVMHKQQEMEFEIELLRRKQVVKENTTVAALNKETAVLYKLDRLRDELHPLKKMWTKQKLVDVEKMRRDLFFYEKEREYLYSKIFGTEMSRVEDPTQDAGRQDNSTEADQERRRRQLQEQIRQQKENDRMERALGKAQLRDFRMKELIRGLEGALMDAHDRASKAAQTGKARRRQLRDKRPQRGPRGATVTVDSSSEESDGGTNAHPESAAQEPKSPTVTGLPETDAEYVKKMLPAKTLADKAPDGLVGQLEQVLTVLVGALTAQDDARKEAAFKVIKMVPKKDREAVHKVMQDAGAKGDAGRKEVAQRIRPIVGQLVQIVSRRPQTAAAELQTDPDPDAAHNYVIMPGGVVLYPDARTEMRMTASFPEERCMQCGGLVDADYETASSDEEGGRRARPPGRRTRVQRKRSRAERRADRRRMEGLIQTQERMEEEERQRVEQERQWKLEEEERQKEQERQQQEAAEEMSRLANEMANEIASQQKSKKQKKLPTAGGDEQAYRGKSAEVQRLMKEKEILLAVIHAQMRQVEHCALTLHHTVFRLLNRLRSDLQIPPYMINSQQFLKSQKLSQMMQSISESGLDQQTIQKQQRILEVIFGDEAAVSNYVSVLSKALPARVAALKDGIERGSAKERSEALKEDRHQKAAELREQMLKSAVQSADDVGLRTRDQGCQTEGAVLRSAMMLAGGVDTDRAVGNAMAAFGRVKGPTRPRSGTIGRGDGEDDPGQTPRCPPLEQGLAPSTEGTFNLRRRAESRAANRRRQTDTAGPTDSELGPPANAYEYGSEISGEVGDDVLGNETCSMQGEEEGQGPPAMSPQFGSLGLAIAGRAVEVDEGQDSQSEAARAAARREAAAAVVARREQLQNERKQRLRARTLAVAGVGGGGRSLPPQRGSPRPPALALPGEASPRSPEPQTEGEPREGSMQQRCEEFFAGLRSADISPFLGILKNYADATGLRTALDGAVLEHLPKLCQRAASPAHSPHRSPQQAMQSPSSPLGSQSPRSPQGIYTMRSLLQQSPQRKGRPLAPPQPTELCPLCKRPPRPGDMPCSPLAAGAAALSHTESLFVSTAENRGDAPGWLQSPKLSPAADQSHLSPASPSRVADVMHILRRVSGMSFCSLPDHDPSGDLGAHSADLSDQLQNKLASVADGLMCAEMAGQYAIKIRGLRSEAARRRWFRAFVRTRIVTMQRQAQRQHMLPEHQRDPSLPAKLMRQITRLAGINRAWERIDVMLTRCYAALYVAHRASGVPELPYLYHAGETWGEVIYKIEEFLASRCELRRVDSDIRAHAARPQKQDSMESDPVAPEPTETSASSPGRGRLRTTQQEGHLALPWQQPASSERPNAVRGGNADAAARLREAVASPVHNALQPLAPAPADTRPSGIGAKASAAMALGSPQRARGRPPRLAGAGLQSRQGLRSPTGRGPEQAPAFTGLTNSSQSQVGQRSSPHTKSPREPGLQEPASPLGPVGALHGARVGRGSGGRSQGADSMGDMIRSLAGHTSGHGQPQRGARGGGGARGRGAAGPLLGTGTPQPQQISPSVELPPSMGAQRQPDPRSTGRQQAPRGPRVSITQGDTRSAPLQLDLGGASPPAPAGAAAGAPTAAAHAGASAGASAPDGGAGAPAAAHVWNSAAQNSSALAMVAAGDVRLPTPHQSTHMAGSRVRSPLPQELQPRRAPGMRDRAFGAIFGGDSGGQPGEQTRPPAALQLDGVGGLPGRLGLEGSGRRDTSRSPHSGVGGSARVAYPSTVSGASARGQEGGTQSAAHTPSTEGLALQGSSTSAPPQQHGASPVSERPGTRGRRQSRGGRRSRGESTLNAAMAPRQLSAVGQGHTGAPRSPGHAFLGPAATAAPGLIGVSGQRMRSQILDDAQGGLPGGDAIGIHGDALRSQQHPRAAGQRQRGLSQRKPASEHNRLMAAGGQQPAAGAAPLLPSLRGTAAGVG